MKPQSLLQTLADDSSYTPLTFHIPSSCLPILGRVVGVEVDRGMSSLPYSQDSSGRYRTKRSFLDNFICSMRNNRHGRLHLQSESPVRCPIFELPRFVFTLRLSPSPPQPSQHHALISLSLHYTGPAKRLQCSHHQEIYLYTPRDLVRRPYRARVAQGSEPRLYKQDSGSSE